MFVQIATLLIDTVVAFLVFLLLARFHFQWLRVPFRNPMGEFVLAVTNWAVMPARRAIPGLAGLDLATLILAWAFQALGLWAQAAIVGAEPSALAGGAGAGPGPPGAPPLFPGFSGVLARAPPSANPPDAP